MGMSQHLTAQRQVLLMMIGNSRNFATPTSFASCALNELPDRHLSLWADYCSWYLEGFIPEKEMDYYILSFTYLENSSFFSLFFSFFEKQQKAWNLLKKINRSVGLLLSTDQFLLRSWIDYFLLEAILFLV